MSTEFVGVIIGGAIGIIGSLSTTLVITFLSNRRRSKSIRILVKGEVTAIKEKAQRYLDGQSSKVELAASAPMFTSISSELGFLSEDQAIAFRRTITLDMEMRKEGTKEKAQFITQACEDALRSLSR
jgi:hypothetical protein